MERNGQNYRELLKNELENRCQKNSRYSLRAFARDLGMSPPRLCHILQGDHGLSAAAASKIGRRLGWSPLETEMFCDLVESEHGRSKTRKAQAAIRLQKHATSYRSLEADAFRVIADWYHFAIMELTKLDQFDSSPHWIAKTLGITIHETTQAIERLMRLEALEERDGKLRCCSSFSVNPAGVPSESVRKFHKQILEKAQAALTFQSTEERDFSAAIIAINKDDLPKARQRLREFREKFDAEFSNPEQKNCVYALGLQFFRFQEPIGEKP